MGEREDELDQREAAARLGVAHITVKRWTADGRVPSRRLPGGARLVRLADIDPALIENARRVAESRYRRRTTPDTLARLRHDLSRLEAECARLRRRIDQIGV